MKTLIFPCSLLLFLAFPGIHACAQADAGPDTVKCSGPVRIGGNGQSDWCFKWSPDSGLTDPKILRPYANPSKTTKYTLKVVGPNFSFSSSDEMTLYVMDSVKFEEDSTSNYGYDPYTSASTPNFSVRVGFTNWCYMNTYPGDANKFVHIPNGAAPNTTVAPTVGGTAHQKLTFTGASKGLDVFFAMCGSNTGNWLGEIDGSAYNQLNKTVGIKLVNCRTWANPSTNCADSNITRKLRRVYKQAVVSFAMTRLAQQSVAFDLNGDGMLDDTATGTFNAPELKAIMDSCSNTAYDYNIFLVNNPISHSFGVSVLNQRYVFVFGNESPDIPTTCAHELGHAAGGYDDNEYPFDPTNLMNQGAQYKWRLRKSQWDQINP